MEHVKTGKAVTKPDALAHVNGINQGNSVGNYAHSPGHLDDGTSTAQRSTGIDPDDHGPADPRMPNLSPA